MKRAPSQAQKSIRAHIKAGLAIVLIFGGGVGVWASTVELSGALIAQGSVIVDSNVKKVQHPTGGIVGELRARDGDHVNAGDIVVRLDDTVTRANLAIVVKGLNELAARKARLESERDGAAAITFPTDLLSSNDPEVAKIMDAERKLFDLRHNARVTQKAQLQHRIEQLNEEIHGLLAQREAKNSEIALVERQLASVNELWKQKLVQMAQVIQLERDQARLKGEAGLLLAQTAQAKGKISETELQIVQIDRDLSSEVAKETREIDGKIGEFIERKITAEDQLKRVDIRAPQTGTVFQSTVHTIGGVITAGEAIMMVVPDADNLSVEAKVVPQDIDQVQLDQKALLRLSAFNTRTTPEITGTVSRISADTSTDQRTGQSFYTVRIAMSADQIKRLGEVKIVPGMPVEAFIQTGERTMMSYLTKPLRDQLMRTFRER